MDLVGVLAGITGGVLVWCSLKNKHPLEVVRLALSGGDPNTAKPITALIDTAAGSDGGPGLTGPNGPLEEYRNYDPNAPGLGGMPTI